MSAGHFAPGPEENCTSEKVIVMVDDKPEVGELVDALSTATQADVFFVLCNGQTLDELVSQILDHKPDRIVMDYDLQGMTGDVVIRKLLSTHENLICVGLSEGLNEKAFKRVRARGMIRKKNPLADSIPELAHALEC